MDSIKNKIQLYGGQQVPKGFSLFVEFLIKPKSCLKIILIIAGKRKQILQYANEAEFKFLKNQF